MSYAVDEARFGRDLFAPLDPDDPLRVTPTGDLPTVAGYANLRQAVEACALTTPGELLHRPEYGGGLPEEVEAPGTPASRARAANRLRRSLLNDARVSEARVSVAPGVPGDTRRLGAVTADVAVTPRGDAAALTVTVTAE